MSEMQKLDMNQVADDDLFMCENNQLCEYIIQLRNDMNINEEENAEIIDTLKKEIDELNKEIDELNKEILYITNPDALSEGMPPIKKK